MSLARGASFGALGGGRGVPSDLDRGRSAPAWKPLSGLCDLAVAGGTTVATISSLLADHVTLQVRSVDRLFLQGYVPRLMTEGQVIRFLLDRGFPIPSPAVLGKIGRDYVNQINQFIVDHEIPTVRFVKGDVKEEIAREHFQARRARGPLRGGDGRDRAGEDLGVARVARRRPGRASALRVSPPVDLPEQLLLLHPRPRLGAGVHQDHRVRAVPGVDLSERERVGQAAGRPARHRVQGVG